MRTNRYVNRYRSAQERCILESVVYCLLFIVLVAVTAHMLNHYRIKYKGELDCSKCHSVEFHETKKMVMYLQEKKYKDPKRWLK